MKPTVKANNTKQPAKKLVVKKPTNKSLATKKPDAVFSLPKGVTESELKAIVQMHFDYEIAKVVKAIEIGNRLIPIKTKVGRGKWLDWTKACLPEISQRSINVYVRLAEYTIFLEGKFKFKLTNPASLKNVPSIDEADKAIREKEGNKPRGKKKVASKAVEKETGDTGEDAKKKGTRQGVASQSKPSNITEFNPLAYDDKSYYKEVMGEWLEKTKLYLAKGKSSYDLHSWAIGFIQKWYRDVSAKKA